VVVAVPVATLSASVGAANAVVAAERTVLSGEFVKAGLAETGAYGTAREAVIEQATAGPETTMDGGGSAGEAEDGGGGPPAVFGNAATRIVDEVVTEAYVQREVERNVDRSYAYLHGDREELVLAVVVVQSLALAVVGLALVAVAGYVHRFGTPAWAQRS